MNLPRTDVYRYEPWPEGEGTEMQFRLVYRGQLPPEKSKSASIGLKHEIRRTLHRQIRQLWHSHPSLREMLTPAASHPNYIPDIGGDDKVAAIEDFANRFSRCGFRFVPLIGDLFGERASTACALDILFLRRDEPGIVNHGGDVDNRIKTLFDALQMPQDCDQVRGLSPAEDEDPFFCLLKNDELIHEVKITTDRLLEPVAADEYINHVHLIIHVRTLFLGGGLSALLT